MTTTIITTTTTMHSPVKIIPSGAQRSMPNSAHMCGCKWLRKCTCDVMPLCSYSWYMSSVKDGDRSLVHPPVHPPVHMWTPLGTSPIARAVDRPLWRDAPILMHGICTLVYMLRHKIAY